MKKLASVLLCGLLTASVTLGIGAHKNIEPTIPTTVPTTLQNITIDGVKDAEYDRALKLNLDAPQFANYNRNENDYALGTAYILCSNDYKYLYICAEIVDTHFDTAQEKADEPWLCDGVEVFIDPTNASEMIEPNDPEEEDCTLAPGGVETQFRQNLSGTKSGQYRIHTTGEIIVDDNTCANYFEGATGSVVQDQTYTVEFKIDLSFYQSAAMGGVTFGEGSEIGFQMMINDLFPGETIGHNVLDQNTDVTYNYHKWNNPFVWQVNEWSYITLGNAQTVAPDNPDPVKKDDSAKDNENGKTTDGNGNTNTNGNGSSNNNGKTVNRVGDSLAIAAAALIVATGTAIVVSKKRR